MKTRTNHGYSILEVIVYMAIFIAFSVLVINSFVVVMTSFKATRVNRDLLESGSNAMERMAREVRHAESVDLVNSVLGSSAGVLQLNTTDAGGGVKTVKFNTASGALNFYEDGSLTSNLLGQSVTVTSLIFRRTTTPHGEAVKIELTLVETVSQTSRSFYDTLILRGEY